MTTCLQGSKLESTNTGLLRFAKSSYLSK
uniref:Uncharacterized protein n=1 Tax=Arundo donax TaxID=35708 RepID=A0A0A9GD36_ARUDO